MVLPTVSTPVRPVSQHSHSLPQPHYPVITTWLHTWQDF